MFSIPRKIATVMQNFPSDWFVAGGWAIDLYLGEISRPHDDIEIAVFRRDQIALQKHLNDWLLQKVGNAKLSVWNEGEFLEPPVHEIHCSNKNGEPPNFEVLLNERDEDKWFYRRNEKTTKSLTDVYLMTDSGIKFLRPEIVLLYKSKNLRAKDEHDFKAVVECLNIESKAWLINALTTCYIEHHWLHRL